jgi:hypothetical protein
MAEADYIREAVSWLAEDALNEELSIEGIIDEDPEVKGYIDDINDILAKIQRAYKQDKKSRGLILKQIEDNLKEYK